MVTGTRSTNALAPHNNAPVLAAGGNDGGNVGVNLPPIIPQVNQAKIQLAALFASFGINPASVTELQDQQFETTEDFVDYDSDDFTPLFKIFTKSPNAAIAPTVWINQKGRKKIIVLHAWVQNRIRLNISYRAIEFTTMEMVATSNRMTMLKTIIECNKTDEVETPKKFIGFHDWEAFDNSLQHYLRRCVGVATCPLTYIIRDDAIPGEKWRDTSSYFSTNDSNDYFTQCVVYTGLWYKVDNSRVWNTLKTACADSSGWEYIKTFEKK